MAKNKVLIIDDEHTILRLSQIFLQKRGYEVYVSLSVQEAKNILDSKKIPDLIVLDLMMPGENGFDFLKWKEKHEVNEVKEIPVIINTAKNLSDEEKKYLAERSKCIMHKGIDFTDRLVAEVSHFLPL